MNQTECLQHTHWETRFRWISPTNTNQRHWAHTLFSEARTLSRDAKAHTQGLRASHSEELKAFTLVCWTITKLPDRYQQSTRHSSRTCKAMWNCYFWKIQYLKQTKLNNVDSHLPSHFASLQSSCFQPRGVRLFSSKVHCFIRDDHFSHSHLLWGLGFSHHPLSHFLKHLKIFNFWLHWVFVAAQGLSLVRVGTTFQLQGVGFSLWWLLSLRSTGPRVCRFQELWCSGLAASWPVGSSGNRNQTQVPCIGRRILNHWTTREGPLSQF